MKAKTFLDGYQFGFMLLSHYNQMRAWQDAAEARVARRRAEALAAEQAQAMLDANPSGQLGRAKLNDEGALRRSGLL
jgi:hypothetical protein